jgi:hypothetical protein
MMQMKKNRLRLGVYMRSVSVAIHDMDKLHSNLEWNSMLFFIMICIGNFDEDYDVL